MYRMPTHGFGGSGRPLPIPLDSSYDSAERHADTAAADWQIILHLRELIERDPAIVTELLRDAPDNSYVATIYAATREALSDEQEHAELHYYAATAALQLGRVEEADHALKRAIHLQPEFAEALLLAARISVHRNQPVPAIQRLRLAEAAGADPHEVQRLRSRVTGAPAQDDAPPEGGS